MTMERLPDYPGLKQTDAYTERAYRLDGGEVVRVRVRPKQVDPGLAAQVSVPVMGTVIAIDLSSSLVDEAGQVLMIEGRGAIEDASPHSWQSEGAPFDPEAWLDALAAGSVERLMAKVADRRAAAAFGLLAPVSPVAPAPELDPVAIEAVPFPTDAELTAFHAAAARPFEQG